MEKEEGEYEYLELMKMIDGLFNALETWSDNRDPRIKDCEVNPFIIKAMAVFFSCFAERIAEKGHKNTVIDELSKMAKMDEVSKIAKAYW